MKVTIVEYRPEWQKMFEGEKGVLRTALGEISAQIEHIGSTAVAGLAAKPIIDIMVGLEDFSIADEVVPRIEALAYEYIIAVCSCIDTVEINKYRGDTANSSINSSAIRYNTNNVTPAVLSASQSGSHNGRGKILSPLQRSRRRSRGGFIGRSGRL